MWTEKEQIELLKKLNLKVGDKVICIDDDSEVEDFGMSGMVLPGRRDLTLRKKYEITSFEFRHIPKENTSWDSEEEFLSVQRAWLQVELKGIFPRVWGRQIKVLTIDSK